MFEAKDVIGEAVSRAVTLFTSHTRGDVVPWALIEAAAGFGRLSPHWAQFNKRFRRDFRNRSGVEVWPVPGVGLKLCTPDEQIRDVPERRQARSLRQLTRAVAAVKAMPDRELTDHQRVFKSHKLAQAREARRAVLQSVRLGHKLAKPSSSGLPVRRSA